MTTQPEILPCPFCGFENVYWEAYDTPPYPVFVRCGVCDAMGPIHYEDDGPGEAIKAWNEAKR